MSYYYEDMKLSDKNGIHLYSSLTIDGEKVYFYFKVISDRISDHLHIFTCNDALKVLDKDIVLDKEWFFGNHEKIGTEVFIDSWALNWRISLSNRGNCVDITYVGFIPKVKKSSVKTIYLVFGRKSIDGGWSDEKVIQGFTKQKLAMDWINRFNKEVADHHNHSFRIGSVSVVNSVDPGV